MSPTPQFEEMEQPSGGTDILITGMSGRFPKSSSVKEFKENLINKVDMMEKPTERWEFSHPEMPPRLGICPDMETFDAQFFAIHYKQSASMDPTIRKLLECACEAVIDAGINPKSLRHSNTGVFMASSISESEKNLNYDSSTISGYGLTGSSRSHMANRISFWLGTHGPSYSSDNACCGGALVLQQAYHAMSQGYCDTAIVGSSNLCLEPCVNLHFRWMDLLTLGEKTKTFDKSADGYLRSDAIVVFFLQKPKDAKRVYAQLLHTKTIYTGINEVDHTFQMLYPEKFGKFLNDFYKETDVKPHEVEYVEACGTGVNKADREELNKIDEIFCGKDRKHPVKVGSVKSNMGNCEASSPLAALVKVCLAYHTGTIASNLHLENPMDDVSGVKDGRIQLLDDHNIFNKGYAAINTYSYNGVNGHILLKNYDIGKRSLVKCAEIPYLICVSSRNEDTLKTTFEDLEAKPLDPRQVALVNNVYGNEVVGFLMRGYKIYSNDTVKPEVIAEGSEYFDGRQRPVWFVYSGMGSQWPTMGAQLMRFPVFAGAIERCCRILDSKGLDLMKLLTDPDPETFSNILHSFVAIAAVQIGLTDLLHSLGIRPDNIIGHSVGELGCAYADGCLTAQEMILSAYYRGLVSIESPLIKGSMAAVGLGYATMRSVCLPEIDVACHNGHDSSTISGPADIMKVFVEELTKRGVFAKEVNCSSIAYHSRYIAAAGPGLKKYMSQVILDPKQRSSRWISSSVPQVRWDEAAARFCSAEYLTNNLLNPVLFEEASRLIPDNAITIEIAPHGLLQAILNRSLSTNCINVSLTRRGHKDNVQHLLNAVGRLYVAGLYPKLENLYPPVQFPVAADTALLSHTLSWMHDEIWPVGCGRRPAPLNTGKYHYVLSTKDCDHEYLTGNFINGINIYPAAAQLVLIWETLGIVLGVPYSELPVRFENVRFNADVVIPTDEPLELTVYLQQNSGNFEITKHGIAVASGVILVAKKITERTLEDLEKEDIILNSDDIYRIFALRGYNYNGEFRSIKSANSSLNKANIDYTDNWVTFLDALMQFFMISKNNTGVSRPRRLESLDIDVKKFNETVEKLKRNEYLEATKYEKHGVTSCAGVVMKEFVTEDFNVTHNNDTTIYNHDFVPYNTEMFTENEALKIHLQTIIENINRTEIRFVEILNNDNDKSIKKQMQDVLKQLSVVIDEEVFVDWSVVKSDGEFIPIKCADVIISYSLSSNKEVLNKIRSQKGNRTSYIFNIENSESVPHEFAVISRIKTTKQYVLLNDLKPNPNYHIIKTDQQNITSIKNLILENISKGSVLLVATELGHDLIDLIKNINKDHDENKVHIVLIEDKAAPIFNINLPLFKEQLKKNLIVNVFKNGAWGSYRFIGFEESRKPSENTELNVMLPGDIESLAWITKTAPRESNRILVKVHYARISSSDLIKVQRRKQYIFDEEILDRTFGMSYSGVTKSGERVMGLVKNNTIASVVEADPELLWPVPEYWTLKEAATVPRAYIQALYYLLDKTNHLPQNMSVLVTNGSGALGQAIISICLGNGCKVFTTVSDRRKKLLLLRMFPQLTENNICASEDTMLLQMVAEGTNGEGCDLIISSVSGAKRLVAMNCLAPLSNFIDIGVDDMEDNAEFGMSFVRAGRAYLAANFASVFAEHESPLRKALRKALYEGIQESWVKPLSHVSFDSQHVSRAFRFLAGRRNHGAVLLRVRSSSSMAEFESLSTWKCEANDSHIVVCDEFSLGIEVAERLVQLGARNLVINNLHKNGYLQHKLKNWKSKGVIVNTLSEDLTSEEAATLFITKATEGKSLKSLFIVSTTEEIECIKHLDAATRTNVNLRKFVIISTIEDQFEVHAELQKIYDHRFNEDLPATLLQCLIKNKNTKRPKQTDILAVSLDRTAKLLNKILCKNNTHLIVSGGSNENITVSKIVAEALGLITTEGLDENLTIGDLDLQPSYLNELCNSLVENYHVSYEISDILGLSLKEIHDLDDNIADDTNANTNAFSMFFRHYESDNLFVSEPLIWMPTVISDGDNRVDFYKGEDYLIVVPGMDGHRHSMYRLCRRLRLRAILCQYPVEIRPNSVQELAEILAATIKTKIGIGSKFHILGYSFGALVALEMAFIFEKNGMQGKVFCLDGSPLSMDAIIKTQTLNLTDEQQQTQLLAHLYQVMTNKNEDISPKIKGVTNWDEKVKICIEQLKGKVEDPFEYQELVLKSAYKRFKFASNYKRTNDKLSSDIILLRAKGNLPLPKDYMLDVMSKKPVVTYDLVSTHLSAPYDLRCSDIINRELDLNKASVEAAVVRLNQLNSSIDGRMIR